MQFSVNEVQSSLKHLTSASLWQQECKIWLPANLSATDMFLYIITVAEFFQEQAIDPKLVITPFHFSDEHNSVIAKSLPRQALQDSPHAKRLQPFFELHKNFYRLRPQIASCVYFENTPAPEFAEYQHFDLVFLPHPYPGSNAVDILAFMQSIIFSLKDPGYFLCPPEFDQFLLPFFNRERQNLQIFKKKFPGFNFENSGIQKQGLMPAMTKFTSYLGKKIQTQNQKFQQLNEELEAYNHELEASNEELRVTNEEVVSTYHELYRKNQALRHSESLINSFFDTADIGIGIVNENGHFVKVNLGFSQIFGYQHAELAGEHYLAIVPEENRVKARQEFARLVANGNPLATEQKALKKDGTVIDIYTSRSVMHDDESERMMVLTVTDITESKKNRDILNITLESLKIGGWEFDLLNRRFSCTREIYNIYSIAEREELDADRLYEVVKDYDNSLISDIIQQVINTGKSQDFETQITATDGTKKWVRVTSKPVKEGRVISKVYGTLQDITETKLTAEKMHKNEQLYQTLTRNFPGGTIDIIDKDLNYVFTGGQELEDLPQSPSEVIGKNIFDIYPESLALVLEKYCRNALAGETITFDIEYNGKCWSATCTPLADPDGQITQLMLLTQNITDRRKADLTLKETHKSLSDFRMALDVATLVIITEANGNITYVNNNLLALTGYNSAELNNADFRTLLSEETHNSIQGLISNKIEKGEVWKGELRCVKRNGEPYWVNTAVIPFKDQNGFPYQYLSISSEITDQKQAESMLKSQNEELIKINTELDRFVYSASHDLRAPLVSILGLLNVARLDTSGESREQYFEMMEKSINKLDTFVQEIIDYSRNARIEVKKEKVNIEEIVQNIFDGLKHRQGAEKVRLYISKSGHGDIYSDKGRLNIVFNNLLSNAVNYRSPRREEPWIKVHIDIKEDAYVIQVADNGMGISQEYLHKIFDMFFRASSETSGSGLGLYIVKESISTLKGHIQVESVQNTGTTFTIKLPVPAKGEVNNDASIATLPDTTKGTRPV